MQICIHQGNVKTEPSYSWELALVVWDKRKDQKYKSVVEGKRQAGEPRNRGWNVPTIPR